MSLMRGALHNPRLAAALLVTAVTAALSAQPTNGPVPDPLAQLMVSQPSIEIVSNPVAVASFDPPMVHPGQLSTYRVSFNALEDSVKLPNTIAAPSGMLLRQSARGQILLYAGNRLVTDDGELPYLRHQHRCVCVGPFTVEVYGRAVAVPAAHLEVVPEPSVVPPPGRRLTAQLMTSNIYVGQSVGVRVSLPASSVAAPNSSPK